MEYIKIIADAISHFQSRADDFQERPFHQNNKLNKQLSGLSKEGSYLNIILRRIQGDNPDKKAAELNLDIKSLYVFGRVFAESVLYLCKLFIQSDNKIDWTKLGPFINSSEKHLSSQSSEFQEFWNSNKDRIISLHEFFKYRHDVLHEKDSNTELTKYWPGMDNLDAASISNVPWKEDRGKKEEKSTQTPNHLMEILQKNTTEIISYLETKFLK